MFGQSPVPIRRRLIIALSVIAIPGRQSLSAQTESRYTLRVSWLVGQEGRKGELVCEVCCSGGKLNWGLNVYETKLN